MSKRESIPGESSFIDGLSHESHIEARARRLQDDTEFVGLAEPHDLGKLIFDLYGIEPEQTREALDVAERRILEDLGNG